MKREIWHPAPYEDRDAYAIQALARGEATPDQQMRALRWIIEQAAQTYEQSFTPDNSRVSDFIEGRRSVGNQLVKLVKLKVGKLQKPEGEQG